MLPSPALAMEQIGAEGKGTSSSLSPLPALRRTKKASTVEVSDVIDQELVD